MRPELAYPGTKVVDCDVRVGGGPTYLILGYLLAQEGFLELVPPISDLCGLRIAAESSYIEIDEKSGRRMTL